jgi:hypothetical protein
VTPLHVFSCYANPQRWTSRLANFQRFETQILGVGCPLTTVELQYGARAWELPLRAGVLRIRLRASSVLWHKENMLNLAAAYTPDWERCACIDGDFHLVDPQWPTETNAALDLHPIVQISNNLSFLGPQGQQISKGTSLVQLWLDALAGGKLPPDGPYGPCVPVNLQGHGYPGGAWGYRREAWDAIGGLLDRCIVGAADHHMAQGLLCIKQSGEPDAAISVPYQQYISAWQGRAERAIQRDVGLVPGMAIHYWHGPYGNRKYSERWKILQRNAYNPYQDVHQDAKGVLNLSGNKPHLRDELRAYLWGRDEDTIEL